MGPPLKSGTFFDGRGEININDYVISFKLSVDWLEGLETGGALD